MANIVPDPKTAKPNHPIICPAMHPKSDAQCMKGAQPPHKAHKGTDSHGKFRMWTT